jgi:ABC-2 type transport system permease protein
MFAALKSELRKLLTVRSTYVISGIAALLIAFFAFYASGYRASAASLMDVHLLKSQVEQAILAVGLLGSIVGVLLVTHEYRYNTIMYTLTSSNSRTKSFVAKLVAVSIFSFVFTLAAAILSPLLTEAGIAVKGSHLIPQAIPLVTLFWKVLFVGWAYGMLSFVFAMVVRIQVGAISTMFLVPAMVEPLLGLLLKKNAIYLPYNALGSILQTNPSLAHISVMAAVGVVSAYVLGGWLIAWQLFLRRDAQ